VQIDKGLRSLKANGSGGFSNGAGSRDPLLEKRLRRGDMTDPATARGFVIGLIVRAKG